MPDGNGREDLLPEHHLRAEVEAAGGELVIPFDDVRHRLGIPPEVSDPLGLIRNMLLNAGLEDRPAFVDGRAVPGSMAVRVMTGPKGLRPDPGWKPPPETLDEDGRPDPVKLVEWSRQGRDEAQHDAALALANEVSPGLILRMDETLPAHDPVAQWLVQLATCFNNILMVQGLRDVAKQLAPRGAVYLFRLRLTTVYEAARLLDTWYEHYPHIRTFVERLTPDAKAYFFSVRALVRAEAEMEADRELRTAYNMLYWCMQPDEARVESLKAALGRAEPDEGYLHWGAQSSKADTWFSFADQVYLEMVGLKDQEAAARMESRLTEAEDALKEFVFRAMLPYVKRLPDSAKRYARPGEEQRWGF